MTAVRPRPNALIWLVLSVVVIILDQWSKAWVLSSLPEYQPVVVIEGFWNWFRTYNTGAAFSFLADAGGWQRWFFTVLAVGISGLLGYWLSRTRRGDWRQAPARMRATSLASGDAGSGIARNIVHDCHQTGHRVCGFAPDRPEECSLAGDCSN